jgi:TATA-box binding protein (TBP) (component of TFIID and TFIIIB)
MKLIFKLLIFILFISGCSNKLKETPAENFIGLWKIEGRSMFDGIQIKIEKKENEFIGRIYKLNDNKMVKLFVDSNDIWVSGIERRSNFEFALTEKKIAKDLFTLYGLPTSQEFKVEFFNKNTFGLAVDNSKPLNSKIRYRRIN